ncbi:unnamed protein product [Vitrella brassicaformis CCMP3155]|uniref:adenosine deaminase n=1 Tax=Vitrella brassicaformis (strain CCMP3155) TaxID=1169540 RepID=A0A0G4EXL5_VITBC|nr:unnamed protein product [Vitrella brassicaformis CCMP3155]|eukprot:CEM03456.1 unnamed protein product [Vitrella brassicaformis CCMP3155]
MESFDDDMDDGTDEEEDDGPLEGGFFTLPEPAVRAAIPPMEIALHVDLAPAVELPEDDPMMQATIEQHDHVEEPRATVCTLYGLVPKADLLCRIEGSVRPQTAVRHYKRLGLPLPQDEQEQLDLFTCDPHQDIWQDFSPQLDRIRYIFDTLEVVEEVTAEAVEDRFKDRVVVLEIRFWPDFFTKTYGHQLEGVLQAMERGVERGRARCNHDIEDCVETIHEAGLGITMPVSDIPSISPPIPDVAALVEQIRPRRIAANLAADHPAALQLIKAGNIGVELKAESLLDLSRARQLNDGDYDLYISINSDLPALFNSRLPERYQAMQDLLEETAFTRTELIYMSCHEIRTSLLPDDVTWAVLEKFFFVLDDGQGGEGGDEEGDQGGGGGGGNDVGGNDDDEAHDDDGHGGGFPGPHPDEARPLSPPRRSPSHGGQKRSPRGSRSPSPPRSNRPAAGEPTARLPESPINDFDADLDMELEDQTPSPRKQPRSRLDDDETRPPGQAVSGRLRDEGEGEGWEQDDPFKTPPRRVPSITPPEQSPAVSDDEEDESDEEDEGDESDGGDDSEEGGVKVMPCVAVMYGCVAAELLRAAQRVLCCLATDIIRTSKAIERAVIVKATEVMLLRHAREWVRRQCLVRLMASSAMLLAVQDGVNTSKSGGGSDETGAAAGGEEESVVQPDALSVSPGQRGEKRGRESTAPSVSLRPAKRVRHSRHGTKRKRASGQKIAGEPQAKRRRLSEFSIPGPSMGRMAEGAIQGTKRKRQTGNQHHHQEQHQGQQELHQHQDQGNQQPQQQTLTTDTTGKKRRRGTRLKAEAEAAALAAEAEAYIARRTNKRQQQQQQEEDDEEGGGEGKGESGGNGGAATRGYNFRKRRRC